MADRWILQVASRERVELWHGEAHRLRATLDAISRCVEREYGAPLVWRDEDLSAEQWLDLDEIVAKMLRERLRDDAGKIMRGGPASGVVLGYRDCLPDSMTSAMWSVGSDGDWPFDCVVYFDTGVAERGDARPLFEHPVDWLVELLCAAAEPSHATLVRILTRPLQRPLRLAREINDVGALTLAPRGIDNNALPASVTAHPCPIGYPDGVVLVADLDRVANDPASLVDDLLAVDDLLRQGASASG